MQNNFKDSDKEKIIEFLNIIASKAKFEFNTQEVIKYYGLLSYIQKELLPKIDSHIFEVKKVIEDKKEGDS